MNILYIIGICFLVASVAIAFAVTVGFIRFQNPFTQIHIASVYEMLGFPLFLIGMIFIFIDKHKYDIALKVILALILWYVITPISSYAIIKIVYFYNSKNKKLRD
jgi:monovalent cation/proton antiporter MnhG/PhaG subunit